MALAFGSLTPNSNALCLTLTTPPLNLIISKHHTKFMFCGRGVSYGHTLSYSDQRASSIATVVCSAANKPSPSSEIRYPLFLSSTFSYQSQQGSI